MRDKELLHTAVMCSHASFLPFPPLFFLCSWVHLILLLHTNRPHLELSWQEAGEVGDDSLLLQVQFKKIEQKTPKLPNKHYTDEWKQTWSKHTVESCEKIKIEWNGFFCAMLALEIIIAAVKWTQKGQFRNPYEWNWGGCPKVSGCTLEFFLVDDPGFSHCKF